MKITLNLNDDVLAALKTFAGEEPVGDVASRLLLTALLRRAAVRRYNDKQRKAKKATKRKTKKEAK